MRHALWLGLEAALAALMLAYVNGELRTGNAIADTVIAAALAGAIAYVAAKLAEEGIQVSKQLAVQLSKRSK